MAIAGFDFSGNYLSWPVVWSLWIWVNALDFHSTELNLKKNDNDFDTEGNYLPRIVMKKISNYKVFIKYYKIPFVLIFGILTYFLFTANVLLATSISVFIGALYNYALYFLPNESL